MNPTIYKLYNETNLCIDMFGRELKAGDTVLCKGYGSLYKDTIATIKRVNKTTINVQFAAQYWDYSVGKLVSKRRLIRRKPIDVMLISPELKTEIESREEYLFQTYPEYFI